MSTPPSAAQARQVTDSYRDLSFQIQGLAQDYIAGGADNPDMRNAIRGILALSAGLVNVLQQALQR
jgi:hypothetical protein